MVALADRGAGACWLGIDRLFVPSLRLLSAPRQAADQCRDQLSGRWNLSAEWRAGPRRTGTLYDGSVHGCTPAYDLRRQYPFAKLGCNSCYAADSCVPIMVLRVHQ